MAFERQWLFVVHGLARWSRVPLRCRLMQSNSPHGLPPAEFAKNTSAKEYNRIHAWDYEPLKHRDVP